MIILCERPKVRQMSNVSRSCGERTLEKSTKWFYSVPVLGMVCLRYYLHYVFVIHIGECKCETVNSNIPIPGMDPQKLVPVQRHRALGKAVLHICADPHISTHTCTPLPSLELTSLHFLFMLCFKCIFFSIMVFQIKNPKMNPLIRPFHTFHSSDAPP